MAKRVSAEQKFRDSGKAFRDQNYKVAEKSLLQGLKRLPKHAPLKQKIKILRALALIAERKGRPEDAQALYQKIIALIENDTELETEFEAQCYERLWLTSRKLNLPETEAYRAKLFDKLGPDDEYHNYSYRAVWLGDLLKMRRFDEACKNCQVIVGILLDSNLSEALNHYRRLLAFLYGVTNQKEKRKSIRQELVSAEIAEQLKKSPEGLPGIPAPSSWAQDHITNFIERSQQASYGAALIHQNLLTILSEKDALFRSMRSQGTAYLASVYRKNHGESPLAEYLPDSKDVIEIFFFMQSHSSFLAACRLALAGQIPEAYMCARSMLEDAMYAFLVFASPETKDVWLSRSANRTVCSNTFTGRMVWPKFDERDLSELRGRIKALYDHAIDEGAHPNVDSFMKHTKFQQSDGALRFELSYLNPDQIEGCFGSLIAVADAVIDTFDAIFDSADLEEVARVAQADAALLASDPD